MINKKWMLLLLGFCFCGSIISCAVNANSGRNNYKEQGMDLVMPTWTRSYQLYGEPHAFWLSEYHKVGANLPNLEKIISESEKQGKRFEMVVYGIPFRDMGQSSAGGFDSFENYLADNKLNAEMLGAYIKRSGLKPRVYLEPDALAHAIQYRTDRHDDPVSVDIYEKRIKAMNELIALYKSQGALVYLDAAHSDWFDYSDEQVQSMARVLNRSGIAKADGLVTNVSNRQRVAIRKGITERTEEHYLSRLLPLLENKHLDVVVDTSRNGGKAHQRQYVLKVSRQQEPKKEELKKGLLFDNEFAEGRLVGSWYLDHEGETWLAPFFGKPMKLSILTSLDKYSFFEMSMTLSAPPWLDAVGDVQLGASPTNNTGIPLINKFRYIKPPDDCDGSLNCPPGWSKHDLNAKTLGLQAGFN